MTDPEELEVEDGDIVICCDILSECALNADLIDAQVEQLMTLAEKFDVSTMVGALTLKILTAKTATMKILSMKTMTVFVTN